jgi:MoxR-like ATPase
MADRRTLGNLGVKPPNDQEVEEAVDVLTVQMADGQRVGNLDVIPLLALQNISKMHKAHQEECIYVVRTVQAARMEPVNDQEVKNVVEDRAVKVVTVQAQTIPRRNADAQAVKMVADQAVKNLRMIPFLPASGISRIYRKV